jgi:hypothetical protein
VNAHLRIEPPEIKENTHLRIETPGIKDNTHLRIETPGIKDNTPARAPDFGGRPPALHRPRGHERRLSERRSRTGRAVAGLGAGQWGAGERLLVLRGWLERGRRGRGRVMVGHRTREKGNGGKEREGCSKVGVQVRASRRAARCTLCATRGAACCAAARAEGRPSRGPDGPPRSALRSALKRAARSDRRSKERGDRDQRHWNDLPRPRRRERGRQRRSRRPLLRICAQRSRARGSSREVSTTPFRLPGGLERALHSFKQTLRCTVSNKHCAARIGRATRFSGGAGSGPAQRAPPRPAAAAPRSPAARAQGRGRAGGRADFRGVSRLQVWEIRHNSGGPRQWASGLWSWSSEPGGADAWERRDGSASTARKATPYPASATRGT